jgi:hypothetical protein
MRIGFPGLYTGHKETEGHERYEGNLLCEQRRNRHGLPRKRAGGQVANAHGRDSGPVILDGVTPVQGVRESRTQGEGV